MNRIRTFLAIPIDEAVAREAGRLIAKIRAPQDHIRWVATENLHVTLAFLGEIDAILVPKITDALTAELPAIE